jgi:hypothetical protein
LAGAFFAGARFVAVPVCFAVAALGALALLTVADPARFAAQRFFSAATIAARPAALSFRFGFEAAGAGDAVSPLAAAQRRL